MEKSKFIAKKAYNSLIEEVELSPKPGLVDRINNGSHTDMTIETFYDSAKAIAPFFETYFLLGYKHFGTPDSLFKKLRYEGFKAEEAMMNATNNINTHKGVNFSFAIILGALGQIKRKQDHPYFTKQDIQDTLLYTAKMCQNLSKQDFGNLKNKKNLTNGEKLYLAKGIRGIRGEAESGYKTLSNVLLPSLEKYEYLSQEERDLRSFITLMSTVEDSNIYHRGGELGIIFLKKEASKIQNSNFSENELIQAMLNLDEVMRKKNLSPGGSADLLSLGIFLHSLKKRG